MKKENKAKSVKRGLKLLRIGWFFHNFMTIIPVIVLVYVQKGITVGDFFLIQGIFRLAAFLFEIPSGYMSDCLSRKRVMIAGGIFSLAGFATIAIAYGFWALVLGEALLGIASALFSGTLEAYTYDLLKRNNTQKQFLKEYGGIHSIATAATLIASVLGGFLFARIGANGILWLEVLFAACAIFAFLFLPELLEVRRIVKHKDAFVDALSITTTTLKNPKLRNLIVFPSLFAAFTIVMFWALQPIMEDATVPVAVFGVFTSLNQLSSMFFSKYAYKICEKLGEIKVSIISIGTIIAGITMGLLATHINCMPLIYAACAILALSVGIRQLNNLQYYTLIHHNVESKERGTVLSTRAMVSTALGSIFLIAAKFLMDGYGITTMLICLFGATILLGISLKNVAKQINK